jgi:hypothetical protein
MDVSTVTRWVVLFVSLLIAIVLSRVLSGLVLGLLGISGIGGFILGFVLYAVVFFGVLYVIEQITGMHIFQF